MRIARISFLLLLVTLGMAPCGASAQTLEKYYPCGWRQEGDEGGLRWRLSCRLHLRAGGLGQEKPEHRAGGRERDGARRAMAAESAHRRGDCDRAARILVLTAFALALDTVVTAVEKKIAGMAVGARRNGTAIKR